MKLITIKPITFKPLDFLGSIKIKLGAVIVAATAVTATVTTIGVAKGASPVVTAIVAGMLALAMVQLLAKGMTSPLRDMANAARSMSSGDYTKRISTTSRDEVGELARVFNVMATELAETDRIRRDLVANVSHELRTPISGIQATLENLVDGVNDPNPEVFHTMLKQTERLGRLVNELLDLSRLESGAVPLDLQPVALLRLLKECAGESLLSNPNVRVHVNVKPRDLQIVCDIERLRQVITNLLANAVRMSPTNDVVELEACLFNKTVRLEVRDHGPGISAEDAQRVFERFYRADSARSSTDAGAGLGLAIVKWIVDLHEGTVIVENNEGRGCRMVVRLPQGEL